MRTSAPGMALPAGLDGHLDAMTALAGGLAGHLTPREVRFLALLGAAPTCGGDILEIGSFKGKSTIILAKSAAFASGGGRVSAVDPLSMPASTDPTDADPAELPGIFRANLEGHGVWQLVDFHQMRSEELGPTWTRPLRLLWIDGDHTYRGALTDFDTFAPFLKPGAIVALHDVLNHFDGPIGVLSDRMLADDRFGACGLVGSIGWGQYLGDTAEGAAYATDRAELRERIENLRPHAHEAAPASPLSTFLFKFHRARVPHREIAPSAWARMVQPRP